MQAPITAPYYKPVPEIGDVLVASRDRKGITKGNDYIIDALDDTTVTVHDDDGKPVTLAHNNFNQKAVYPPGEPLKKGRPMKGSAPRAVLARA